MTLESARMRAGGRPLAAAACAVWLMGGLVGGAALQAQQAHDAHHASEHGAEQSTGHDEHHGAGHDAHHGAAPLDEATLAAEREAVREARRRGGARWGASYFPNVELITQDGERVRFFDDLIKDKVVLINFIYTRCTDSCPIETARLLSVHEILGDRVGQDVFMYSISVDPEYDTPEVLKAYAQKFGVGAGWTFLTGEEADITLVQRRLGIYVEEVQRTDPTNHNVSLMIGNQRTGQWMKRSPFEDPYFLAAQVGSWLTSWAPASAANQNSYADAPQLRTPSTGEKLFVTRCAACHTIGGGEIRDPAQRRMGPDLLNVTQRRDPKWLARWIAEPDRMLAEGDPLATALYRQYNELPMPNVRLLPYEVEALIEFMAEESLRVAPPQTSSTHVH